MTTAVAEAMLEDVRVCWLDLDAPANDSARWEAVLDPAERARASSFYFPHDARRFTFARAALRTMLGRLLGVPADRVAFAYGAYGKPELDRARHDTDITFNVSHSGNTGVIAVTTGRRIGVDVERIRTLEDMEALAARVFSQRELDALSALPAHLRTASFFDGWTRKEAFIKATGAGLSQPLDRFSVTLTPGDPVRMLEIDGNPSPAAAWSLHSLPAPPGFTAALVCEGQPRAITPLPLPIASAPSIR